MTSRRVLSPSDTEIQKHSTLPSIARKSCCVPTDRWSFSIPASCSHPPSRWRQTPMSPATPPRHSGLSDPPKAALRQLLRRESTHRPWSAYPPWPNAFAARHPAPAVLSGNDSNNESSSARPRTRSPVPSTPQEWRATSGTGIH